MELLVTSPEKFAAWFSKVVPGAYRQITADDTRLLTEIGLIGRYGYYFRQDIEMVRGILLYEQLREERSQKLDVDDKRCKICGQLLPEKGNGRGRPKEYCQLCEGARARQRYNNWTKRQMTSN